MLGEDEGAIGGVEVVGEGEDVGKGGGGHVEENVLHVYDEEDCGHGAWGTGQVKGSYTQVGDEKEEEMEL